MSGQKDTTIIMPIIPASEEDKRKAIESLRQKEQAEIESLKHKDEREAAMLEKRRETLREQFDAFTADTRNIETVQRRGYAWHSPGVLVEMFQADFTPPESSAGKLIGTEAYYKRLTPYAKVLASSDLNDKRYQFKPGTILELGDKLAAVAINPDWEDYHRAAKSNARVMGPEPPKYIRLVHQWIIEGRLYFIDKAKYIATGAIFYGSPTDINAAAEYDGDWIFDLEPYEIGRRVITTNPWV